MLFHEIFKHFKALPIGHQNEQISSDFLLDFKGAFPFTMTVSKIMDFKENDLFQENEQNEHISMKSSKLKNYQILGNFQKIAFHRLVYLNENFYIFIK